MITAVLCGGAPVKNDEDSLNRMNVVDGKKCENAGAGPTKNLTNTLIN